MSECREPIATQKKWHFFQSGSLIGLHEYASIRRPVATLHLAKFISALSLFTLDSGRRYVALSKTVQIPEAWYLTEFHALWFLHPCTQFNPRVFFNKWPCHIKKEELLLKTLKGDSPCDFPSTARKKKKTTNHSSWHNGAEQRILEFERLWNCHVGKFLFDLVLEDKKFMSSLSFGALSRLLRNRLVYWVQLECFLTNDGNVFGNVLSVGICQY